MLPCHVKQRMFFMLPLSTKIKMKTIFIFAKVILTELGEKSRERKEKYDIVGRIDRKEEIPQKEEKIYDAA